MLFVRFLLAGFMLDETKEKWMEKAEILRLFLHSLCSFSNDTDGGSAVL